MSVTTIGELVEQIGVELKAAEAEALNTWRRWAKEAQIREARIEYRDSIDIYEASLIVKRDMDQAVKTARAAHSEAVSEAEYLLEVAFEKKGNSWLQVKEWVGAGGAENWQPLDEPRPVTADGRKEWLARQAARMGPVVHAAAALDKAEWDQAQAVDSISVADRRVTAAKYQLQAATAMLTTLARAMPGERP